MRLVKRIFNIANVGPEIYTTDEYIKLVDFCANIPLDMFHKLVKGAISYNELALENVGSATINSIVSVLAKVDSKSLLRFALVADMVGHTNILNLYLNYSLLVYEIYHMSFQNTLPNLQHILIASLI